MMMCVPWNSVRRMQRRKEDRRNEVCRLRRYIIVAPPERIYIIKGTAFEGSMQKEVVVPVEWGLLEDIVGEYILFTDTQ